MNMRGATGSLNTLMRTLGQTIGVAVLGAAMNYAMNAGSGETASSLIAEGLHLVFIISALMSVISLFLTILIPRKRAEEYAN